MKLRHLGTDPDSVPDQSPSVYETDRDTYVVQGWKVTDHEALDSMRIPDHERVIEIPKRLMQFFPEVKQGHGANH